MAQTTRDPVAQTTRDPYVLGATFANLLRHLGQQLHPLHNLGILLLLPRTSIYFLKHKNYFIFSIIFIIIIIYF